jgi:hypothetical protein
VLVGSEHPEEIKPTHWFPTLFLLGCIGLLLTPLIQHCTFQSGCRHIRGLSACDIRSFVHGKSKLCCGNTFNSIGATSTWGYGLGFLNETLKPKGN